jgi:hypothetical protein
MGDALYPHPQWERMAATWQALYPMTALPAQRQQELGLMEAAIPTFVEALLAHRSPALRGRLGECFPVRERQPARLLNLYRSWAGDLGRISRQPPSLVFAAVGQARADGRITPEAESSLISALLRAWALRSTLSTPTGVTTHIHSAIPRAS